FHQISTDEVYGSLDKTGESFTEKDLLNPRNPYSASKAGAEMLVNSYHETFGLNTVITRSSNTFGPNQDASKLIPRFIGLLQKGEKVNLCGKGEQIREWLYVEDCISGINAVFENGHNGEIYNVGGGLEMTNYELTLELLKSFDKDETSISYVEDRLGHDFRYSMNTSKIKDELDWSPKVSFEEGLENTISSYEPE
ncbi:MAG: GDP-mannose 4,6-dehydratase, partial [Bdellovibrionales bacterium]|nr:GDP-mannose 4,6-dehydratase [Bdellovibrionales bacterium]